MTRAGSQNYRYRYLLTWIQIFQVSLSTCFKKEEVSEVTITGLKEDKYGSAHDIM
jgi:hypothetical protein